jgi:hypothetical protein
MSLSFRACEESLVPCAGDERYPSEYLGMTGDGCRDRTNRTRLRQGVPLLFEFADLGGALDLAVELVVATDLVAGDGVVDDVIDRPAGEREDAVQRPARGVADQRLRGIQQAGKREGSDRRPSHRRDYTDRHAWRFASKHHDFLLTYWKVFVRVAG